MTLTTDRIKAIVEKIPDASSRQLALIIQPISLLFQEFGEDARRTQPDSRKVAINDMLVAVLERATVLLALQDDQTYASIQDRLGELNTMMESGLMPGSRPSNVTR